MNPETNGENDNKVAIAKIISKYPLQTERFVGKKDGMLIVALVSRNEKGEIIFVQPGSTKDLTLKKP